jgi:TetR/AcrR family transcriptional repressor of nem operon
MDKKKMKQREIIEKSFYVMYANGYHGTGVKDLTDAAGIPKGSLYNYFANKEDYAKEALYYYHFVRGQERFNYLKDDALSHRQRIMQFFRSMIDDFQDEANMKLGCFIGNLTQEMGGNSDVLSTVADEVYMDFEKEIRDCLQGAVESGEIKTDMDVGKLAEFVLSSWQGTLIRLKAKNSMNVLENFYEVLNKVLL